MAPLSQAERAKRYREKNKEKVFMCSIIRKMEIQMFMVTPSFPCPITLIKHVLSAMGFMS